MIYSLKYFYGQVNQRKHKCRIDKKCQAYSYNEEAWNYKECYLHQTNRGLYIDPWIIVGIRKSDSSLEGWFSNIRSRFFSDNVTIIVTAYDSSQNYC